jgi:hypothetical protein
LFQWHLRATDIDNESFRLFCEQHLAKSRDKQTNW